jgi:hypothetical protein
VSVEPSINGELEHAPIPSAGPVRVLERRSRLLPALPLSDGLVAAGGGFLAALFAVGTLRAVRGRRGLRPGRRRSRKELVTRSVVAKRSFLVDVHVLRN